MQRMELDLVFQGKKKTFCVWHQEMWVQSLGWENPLEEGMATHTSILALKIPWTEELAGCSPWDHELDTTEATQQACTNVIHVKEDK